MLRGWWGWAAALLVAGCVSSSERRASVAPTPEQARAVTLVRGSDGARAAWEDLLAEARVADVVFVGELHGHPLGLASAAALFEDLLERAPRASLSMEFLERDEQVHVDDYLSGVMTLEQFERASGRSAGNFPPGHRAMVESAARAGRAVHAANAPRRYVSLARREGYERLRGLSEEQRRNWRLPDELIGGRYRSDFDKVMTPADESASGDDSSPQLKERLDSVYRSQQVWDWTMAETVAAALCAGERPVVHVVGNFHVNHRGGTVQALERLMPGVRVLIVTFVDAWSEGLAPGHEGRGDFVAYVGPAR